MGIWRGRVFLYACAPKSRLDYFLKYCLTSFTKRHRFDLVIDRTVYHNFFEYEEVRLAMSLNYY